MSPFVLLKGKALLGIEEGSRSVWVLENGFHLETGMLLANSTAQDCHHEVWSHRSKVPDKKKGQPCTQPIQPVGPNFSSALGSMCQDEMHQERYHFAKS